MLKPALARGLQLVGATTLEEYRKGIEKDAALTRRFQTVTVDAPSVESTITILRGLKTKYEVHHGISISDSSLVTAAAYASRYLRERNLPDSAIDLLDEAASALRLARESKPEELEVLERNLTTLKIELSSLSKDEDSVSIERRGVIEEEVRGMEAQANAMEQEWLAERRKMEEIKENREKLEKAIFELETAQRYAF